MEIKLGRDLPPQETNYLKVIIGSTEFRLMEKNGKLVITKSGDETDELSICPHVNNEISIS